MVLANYQHDNMGPLSSDIFILAITMYLVVLVFSFIILIKRNTIHEKSIREFEEEKEKLSVGYLNVRADRKQVKIAFDDITYVESLADYVKIHNSQGKGIISRERISKLEKDLPGNFLRIHRSFIVNKDKIESFNKEVVVVQDIELPISRSYKTIVFDELS